MLCSPVYGKGLIWYRQPLLNPCLDKPQTGHWQWTPTVLYWLTLAIYYISIILGYQWHLLSSADICSSVTMVFVMTRGETLLFLHILFFYHSNSQKVDQLNTRRCLFTPPHLLLWLSGVNGAGKGEKIAGGFQIWIIQLLTMPMIIGREHDASWGVFANQAFDVRALWAPVIWWSDDGFQRPLCIHVGLRQWLTQSTYHQVIRWPHVFSFLFLFFFRFFLQVYSSKSCCMNHIHKYCCHMKKSFSHLLMLSHAWFWIEIGTLQKHDLLLFDLLQIKALLCR